MEATQPSPPAPAAASSRYAPAFVVVALAIAVLGAHYAIQQFVHNYPYGVDFAVYHIAGRAVTTHHSLFSPWLGHHLHVPLPFTYPPAAALFAIPISVLPRSLGLELWTLASIAVLVRVVQVTTRPFTERVRHPALVTTLFVVVALAMLPVQDELAFGQVGIFLMAMCLFDCMSENPRWPRGALIGVAAAIKLLPAVFIPYLWLTGRRRAAIVAAGTTAGITLVGFVVLPHDSTTFWTNKIFNSSRVGNPTYFSNQSIEGMLRRAFGTHTTVLWFVLAAAVVAFGLVLAARASRRGDELVGVCITGLIAVAASPVSWIHHMVWIVPVLAALLGDGRNVRRVALVIVLALFFTLHLPYWGDAIIRTPRDHIVGDALIDVFGIVAIGLLFALAALTRRRPAPVASPA